MVHLSCGQCRKIQQFSGEPPRCEICGWQVGPLFKEKPFDGGEVAPKFQRKQNPINKLLAPVGPAVEKIIKFVVFGSLSLVGLLLLVYWLKPEKEKLAEQYGVSADKVFVEPSLDPETLNAQLSTLNVQVLKGSAAAWRPPS